MFILISITFYYLAFLKYKPYNEEDILKLEKLSMGLCYLTIFLGIFCYKNPYESLKYLSIAIIVVSNFIFIVYISWKLLNLYLSINFI